MNKLDETQILLESIYENKVNGIILRSKANWHEKGEKSSKYFLNLEKHNHVKKQIRKLNVNGKEITDAIEILQSEKQYYKNVYSKKQTALNDGIANEFFNNPSILKLSHISQEYCDKPLSIYECRQALDTFENGKSPGNDGLPIEFYKCFWEDIKNILFHCYEECFDKGELSYSQKQAVITLIPKMDKDRSNLSNWRPISYIRTLYLKS